MVELMELANEIGQGINGAIFDKHRFYRYALWRIWDRDKPAVIFIGFNPSRADAIREDPTLVKLFNYARSWGYGGLYLGNLYALISTQPWTIIDCLTSGSRNTQDPVGAENNRAIEILARCPGIILVGWGGIKNCSKDRANEVLKILGKPVYCLATTRNNQPAHPLYLPHHYKPKEYTAYFTKEEQK